MDEPIRISELIKILQKIKRKEGDLDCLTTRYSDYMSLTADEISVKEAVKCAEWYERVHSSMPPGSGKKCLHFEGN